MMETSKAKDVLPSPALRENQLAHKHYHNKNYSITNRSNNGNYSDTKKHRSEKASNINANTTDREKNTPELVKRNSSSDRARAHKTAPMFRKKYHYTLVLKSLNNTFETKYLVIPFKPDGLKLGRPVANTNSNDNISLNNGGKSNKNSSTSTQVHPDNGNFDSRVLSRNHAYLSCDYYTGKIYLRDLKSSNGTFLNGKRIDQHDIEIKIGDLIDLGTDIDTKLEHRKISAIIEDVYIHPLFEYPDNSILASNVNPLNNGILKTIAFEASLNHSQGALDLEDTILRSDIDILSGIFINNSIGTSQKLIDVIRTLASELATKKIDKLRMKTVENFFIRYTADMDYQNKLLVEQNDKDLIVLQTDIKNELSNKLSNFMKDHERSIKETKELRETIVNSSSNEQEKINNRIKLAKGNLEDLKTRLEVEKFKNEKLQKRINDISILNEEVLNSAEKANEKPKSNKPRPYLRSWTFWTVGVVSVGVLTIALKLSSR
ncbi:Vacuolar protein sorting-associated protein 64 [Nakaseomyces bracarensis]|uniref:Vacuolar protein sorting-associated protein 64 n=1 Tax=Nakaseomyces bracarensis TaxID=273131 RepID=A0ABR4NZ12_9SACH